MDIGRTDSFPNRPTMKVEDTRQELDLAAKRALLDTFRVKNRYPQLIHIHTEEFSAVCPGTGLPDIGVLDIDYLPNGLCVELKALKYYLFSFRDDGIFQEPVTDVIFGDLWELLQPHYLRVRMKYNTRGGFDTTVTVEKGDAAQLNPDATSGTSTRL